MPAGWARSADAERHERRSSSSSRSPSTCSRGDAADVPAEHEAALAESLSRLAPMVTGDTRAMIGRHFESTGAVERACRRLADPRPHVRAVHRRPAWRHVQRPSRAAADAGAARRRPDVRLAAARSLGRLRARPAAAQLLYSLVRREVPRAVATGALLSIGAAALPGVRRCWPTPIPRTSGRRRAAGTARQPRGQPAAPGAAGGRHGGGAIARLPRASPAGRP